MKMKINEILISQNLLTRTYTCEQHECMCVNKSNSSTTCPGLDEWTQPRAFYFVACKFSMASEQCRHNSIKCSTAHCHIHGYIYVCTTIHIFMYVCTHVCRKYVNVGRHVDQSRFKRSLYIHEKRHWAHCPKN